MYELYIANKNYSSWSLRPWVLLRGLGIRFDEKLVPFEGGVGANWATFRTFSPTGKVPCLRDGDAVVWDSLAIAEYLAERHAGVWPADPQARADQQGALGHHERDQRHGDQRMPVAGQVQRSGQHDLDQAADPEEQQGPGQGPLRTRDRAVRRHPTVPPPRRPVPPTDIFAESRHRCQYNDRQEFG